MADLLRQIIAAHRAGRPVAIPSVCTAHASVLLAVMLADPDPWQDHYRGTSAAPRIERHFGLADRIRYFRTHPRARAAVARLFADLDGRQLPGPALHAHFSDAEIASARQSPHCLPQALAIARVQSALRPYFFNSGPRP